jgi:light-regulated signal transduction histidine kinase (bacteriophytochrome)
MQTTLATVQRMLAELGSTSSLAGYHQACAEQVRSLTGFDRVMIYRFLEDGSGTVIAETKSEEMESYLGLHYPESDIPKQARELYRTNWMRSIPDVSYTPLPLHPETNPSTRAPLDLSHSVLRSVSPLHVQYLKNMGVGASMSLSIVHRDQLWGLIACHHRTPHFAPCDARAACEIFAQVYSLQLESRLHAETYEYSLQQRSVHQQMVTRLAREEHLSDGLIRYRPNLLDLIQADGVAVWVDGEFGEVGHTPGAAAVQSLVRQLDQREDEGVFSTACLAEEVPECAGVLGDTAGLLALSVSRARKDYILWFRREIVETVTWAGNPTKAIQKVGTEERLTPRASFAAWRETVRGRSRPWQPNEIEAAQALRLSILEVVLRRIDQVARERAEAQERQALLVAELDHRVKNTLASIQSIMRHTRRSQTTLDDYVENLGQRIKAMAHTHNLLSQSRWRGAKLHTLIEEELRPYNGKSGAISIAGPKLELEPRPALTLSMVIHELTTNAAKYGALSTAAGKVSVTWSVAEDTLRLQWRETGGPPVAPPARKGFGRTVIESALAHEFGGDVNLRFEPEGVECSIQLPIDLLQGHSGEAAAEHPESRKKPKERDGPLRVLLVEDSLITALDVARVLEEKGFEVLGPTGRVSSALNMIENEQVDVGVLDINLGKEDSFPIADRLRERGTPFLFLTGYDAGSVLPDRFKGGACLSKPFADDALIDALARLTSPV